MKIAIDLDGTAWYHRYFFKEFVAAMQFRGHEVGILTSHNIDLKEGDLKLWRKRGFNQPDFYIAKTDVEKRELKSTKGNNGTWKARMVEKHDIDYLIGDLDGNEEYLKAFRDRFPDKIFLSLTNESK